MSRLDPALAAVGATRLGLGCMNLSHGYGQPLPDKEAVDCLHAAFDAGYRHFDTATLYGATRNERVVGNALSARRNQLFLASKCGMSAPEPTARRIIDGRPETIRQQCEASLQRLQTDHIDLYYLHRLDPAVPVEESVGALADLVAAGKIRYVGLSEVSASTLARADAVHPVAAVQQEYALWSRNPEIGLLPLCRERGIALVAFGALGRGYLAGAVPDPTALDPTDLRRTLPRFQSDHHASNRVLFEAFADEADALGLTPAQLALAWVLQQDSLVIALAGSRRPDHMRENLAVEGIRLSAAVVTRIEALLCHRRVAGRRYGPGGQADVDTECFPDE